MSEIDLLESSVSEYEFVVEQARVTDLGQSETDRIVRILSHSHDWTDEGARVIVSLASDYGAFMLRNALALAVALGKEDGNLGF